MTLHIGKPEFPVGGDSGSLADWAELYVIAGGGPLRRGSLSRTAEREGGSSAEADSDAAWLSLADRSALHGTRWPLRLENELLALADTRPDVHAFYTFLSAMSLRADVTQVGRRLFEHCVTDLVPAITQGPSIRIGSPRAAPVPRSFDEAVAFYSEQSHETAKRISDPDHAKDLGLDVASWTPFGDRRGSYVHMVGQCATGGNWRDKARDLSLERWHDHVQWAVWPPIRFFAIPGVILTRAELRHISLEAGLVLDRPRLLELCFRRPLSEERTREIEEYCALLLPAA